MLGQGSPGLSRQQSCRSEYGWSRIFCLAIGLLLCSHVSQYALASTEEIDLRLHIAWGGGNARAWQAVFRLNEGEFLNPTSLGQEADDVGLIETAPGTMRVIQRSPSRYAGIDVSVKAPAVAELSLELTPLDRPGSVKRYSIPVADLVHKELTSRAPQPELDDQKNSLLVTRAPGDRLRVRFERESLVFAPNEKFDLAIQPHALSADAGAVFRCRLQLQKARSDEVVWSDEKETRVADNGVFAEVGPVAIPLPDAEGVYDVVISLTQKRLADSINPVRAKPLAVRKVQLVVVSPQPQRPTAAAWKSIGEVDPLSATGATGTTDAKWSDWLKRMPQLKLTPSLTKGPIGNNKSSKRELNGQSLVQLEADGWLAYPLPVGKTDEPHILEIQYPTSVRQTFGISIVEPNAAGKVLPIGLDSGVDVPEPIGDQPLAKHRLVFWPRTKTPLVLIANRRDDGPALFGKLSVLAGPTSLPPMSFSNPISAPSPAGRKPNERTLGERQLTAFFDKPLFPENFGAGEALDPASHGTLDDWLTFYLGAKRLIEYLKFAGYNSAVITVACEGSAIYPSPLLQPTPKYDTGVFFASGQDPLRKDVVELLFRLFDREGLTLIPSIQFAAPLPELEAAQRQSGDPAAFSWIAPDGRSLVATNGTRRGLAPHYNPLHPPVRDAMQRVVTELVARYGRHGSFGGVSLQLGPYTFAQLPSDPCGFDDQTIAAFENAARLKVPGQGEQRFAQRATHLQGPGAAAWHQWRAAEMTNFYRQLERIVTSENETAKLYLTAADVVNDPLIQNALRPTLPAQTNLAEAWLRVGIDPKRLAESPSLVLARPQRVAPVTSLTMQAVNISSSLSNELDQLFASEENRSVHHYHEVQPQRLPTFDAVSPFGPENTHTSLLAHVSPSSAFNRRRLVHSLAASDPQMMIDGGFMLSLGEEESWRSVVEVFRQLPATNFATARPAHRDSTQPLIVRSATVRGRTFVYVVNDSRWSPTAEIDLDGTGPNNVSSLGRPAPPSLQQHGTGTRWLLKLEPFDVQAIVVNSANARVADFRVKLDNNVLVELAQQIEEVRGRANSLRNPKSITVLKNPSFESLGPNQPLGGWVTARGNGLSIAADTAEFYGGQQSLHVTSQGPVAWVRSEPIAVPSSGRLAMWVWLKIPNATQQPPLRLSIEGKLDGQTYYRFATVGVNKDAQLQTEWRQFRFQVTDLPPVGLTDLRIGFDLMGSGDVRIDDVQLFDMWFFNHERDELVKRIAAADLQLEQRAVLDCARFLESYWPRLLAQQIPLLRMANVPNNAGPPPANRTGAAASPNAAPGATPTPPPTAAGDAASQSWRDRLLPKKLRPF